MKPTLFTVTVLFIFISSGCTTTDPSAYFNRPVLDQCATLIQSGDGAGKMACNGVIMPIPSGLIIFKDSETVERATKYYESREEGHYICLIYPRRCSI